MQDNTLAVILSRFGKLDTKNDEVSKAIAALASRVTAVETKLETQLAPVVAEQNFRRRAAYLGHVVAVAIRMRRITLRPKPEATAKDVVWELSQLFPASPTVH